MNRERATSPERERERNLCRQKNLIFLQSHTDNDYSNSCDIYEYSDSPQGRPDSISRVVDSPRVPTVAITVNTVQEKVSDRKISTGNSVDSESLFSLGRTLDSVERTTTTTTTTTTVDTVRHIERDSKLNNTVDINSSSDSDSGSYHSVGSFLTISDSSTTLYDSAQSARVLPNDKLTIPNHQQQKQKQDSSIHFYQYPSCPNLSFEGYSCPLPPAPTRSIRDHTMSSLEDGASPKQSPEEGNVTKKKGLISSFRKSRKTGRKIRQQQQQKKASENESGALGTSDCEHESLVDSESSAPASPAPVKSQLGAGKHTDKEKDETTETPSQVVLDSHQATHERLNGSTSPKTGSKNASPSTLRSSKGQETLTQQEGQQEEEKKKEKSKFTSFLQARKERKQKVDSNSKLSLASSLSASDSVPEVKPEGDSPAVGESGVSVDDPNDLSNDPNQGQRDPSFKSYISSVQLVKNWTVNASQDFIQDTTTTATTTTTTTTTTTMTTSTSTTTTQPPTENTSTDKREHLYKILVIGELGTGKTSIIKRYVHQFFSQHYRATIGVDFALKVINWDCNTVIRLQLWDIAGQERFGNMTRVYYKEAVGAFVVFDVTRAQTFDAVAKWKSDLDTKVTLADGSPIPAILLANKCDQPKEGVVNNPARMDDYCRERGFSGWFETSAKENINIDEASRFLVNKILSNEKQGMMLTESLDTDKFSVDGKTNQADRTGCRC